MNSRSRNHWLKMHKGYSMHLMHEQNDQMHFSVLTESRNMWHILYVRAWPVMEQEIFIIHMKLETEMWIVKKDNFFYFLFFGHSCPIVWLEIIVESQYLYRTTFAPLKELWVKNSLCSLNENSIHLQTQKLKYIAV